MAMDEKKQTVTWGTIHDCDCTLLDPRSHRPWPKLQMDEEEYETWIQQRLSTEAMQIFLALTRNFGRRLPDKNYDLWIIERFVFAKQITLVNYLEYLRKKNYTFKISAKELWCSLEWARLVAENTRSRSKRHFDVFKDILGESALKCQYGNVNKNEIQFYIKEYVKLHPNVAHGKWHVSKFDNKSEEISHAESALMNAMKTPNVIHTFDSYINISYRAQQRGECIICPGIFLSNLGIKTTTINKSHDYDNNNGLIRFGNVPSLDKLPEPLINHLELKNCLEEVQDQKQNNNILTELLTEYNNLETSVNKFQETQTTLQKSIGNSDIVDSFWVPEIAINNTVKNNMNVFSDMFLFMTEKSNFTCCIDDLIQYYVSINESLSLALKSFVIVVHHYNKLNKESHAASDDKMTTDVLDYFTIQIHNSVKKIKRKLFTSSIFPNLQFYLSCLWSSTYTKDEMIPIKLLFTELGFDKVAVSSKEIIHWSLLLNGFLDDKATGKDGTQIYYKTWIEDAIMCDIFVQITDYMYKYLRKMKNDCLNDS